MPDTEILHAEQSVWRLAFLDAISDGDVAVLLR